MKFYSLLLAILMLAAAGTSHAQEMETVLLEMGSEGVEDGYLDPLMHTVGKGMNNGWYNSSKTLSFFGLRMGISIYSMAFTFGQITDDMKTFDFDGDIPFSPILEQYVNLSLVPDSIRQQLPDRVHIQQRDVPTIYGSDEPDSITLGSMLSSDPDLYSALFEEQDTGGVTIPALLDSSIGFALPFRGLVSGEWWGSLPNITAISLGLTKIPGINNIQLGLSYIPTIVTKNSKGLGELEFGFFSYKVQHEFTAHIPGISKMEILHGSLFWAQNALNFSSGNVSMEMNNWTAMLNASLDLKLLFLGGGAFAGIGYESSSMSVEVVSDAGDPLSGFSYDIEPDRNLRYQLGARLSLFLFDFWFDYNVGHINSYTL
jgi:hypothetical protein